MMLQWSLISSFWFTVSVLILLLNYYNFRAFQVAHQAFDEAICGIDLMDPEEPCKDSTLILKLLKDNLALWISDVNTFVD